MSQFYLNKWKSKCSNRLYVYDLKDRKSFEVTSLMGVALENHFNDFSFDKTVLGLINYTFMDRARNYEASGMFRTLLSFFNFMDTFDLKHKESNLLEEWFGHFESDFEKMYQRLFKGDLQVIEKDPMGTFTSLMYLFFSQFGRTKKLRDIVMSEYQDLTADGVVVSEKQKEEYFKIALLILSFATVGNVMEKGCHIKIFYARNGGKFLTSDAPAIMLKDKIERLEDLVCFMPLTPRYAMMICDVGIKIHKITYADISYDDVHYFNQEIVLHAHRYLYFDTNSQRSKYVDLFPPKK